MTTTESRPSAKIYAFPAGGRSATAMRRTDAVAHLEQAVRSAPRVTVEGAWYHEAAIQDAARVAKR